jgi:murein L,D-transpeptidase YcbB/YkuD
MQAGAERTVTLTAPLPVYIGYWTARAAADGTVQFRKDVYGLDERLLARLIERQQRSPASVMALSIPAGDTTTQR